MKRVVDLSCASPASTVICTSHDHCSIIRHGTRPQPLHRSDHGDLPRTIKTQFPIPCTSYQLAITPRPKSHCDDGKRIGEGQRKSSADARDRISLSPPGSSRYLLSNKPFVEPVSELNRSTALVPVRPGGHSMSSDGPPSLKASYSARTQDQVVVLRVSLHCKGCESKVRKHLSRMEGVRSFSIDFEKKKVTGQRGVESSDRAGERLQSYEERPAVVASIPIPIIVVVLFLNKLLISETCPLCFSHRFSFVGHVF